MPAILDQKTSKPARSGAAKTKTPIVVATDGTSQSDQAIAIARVLAARDGSEIKVVTIVDHLPMPWGGVDRHVVAEYEKSLQAEAIGKVTRQIASFGLESWPVSVQTGDPATRITALAKDFDARLVLVGLGGHGAAARFFGSETALRLVRVSRTPVLAVAPQLRDLPRRIVVAMDFSEASIEAARLALEIAAKDAIVSLVHVVPWERKEYIPEGWFHAHEERVGGELTRVTRWLDESRKFHTSPRILYGKPASALLAYAEEFGADLIVAGSHSRGLVGRLLAGQTIAKLIRGARCSVLVLPAAAAFRIFETPASSDTPSARAKDWGDRLDEFSRRNQTRRGRLEIDSLDGGAQVEMSGYRFLGAFYESRNERAMLMFGDTSSEGPHLVRSVSHVKSVDVLRGTGPNEADVALAIKHDGGQTLLVLDDLDESAVTI
jgi:nucleotide-binding universal stress UspA family protein